MLVSLAFWLFDQFGTDLSGQPIDKKPPLELPGEDPGTEIGNRSAEILNQVPEEIIPDSKGELVRHTWFALSYSENHEQAEWVAYELTRERLNANWAERPKTFRPDPEVRTESATPRDYSGSGYDKGHLCPAADMAFDATAIDETFLMSNISPQFPAFNMGIWRELEELTRDWARRFKKIYVVTGPVLTETDQKPIGLSKVTIPKAFFKVLLVPDQQRAIAFILPNERSEQPVMDYACTIDAVENSTGIDLFPKLLNGPDEELEASLDKSVWPVKRARYVQRVKVWNLRR